MTRYVPEYVPPEEAPTLSEMLQREHSRMADAIFHRLDLEAEQAPTRPRDGMLRYFDVSVFSPTGVSGLHLYRAGAWRRLAEV